MTPIDNLVARLQTNHHGRAALGLAAKAIRKGFEVTDEIRPSPWDFHLEDIGNSEVRKQARELLERSNAYAQGIYATLPDNAEPLSDIKREYVRTALDSALTNLQLLVSVRRELVQDFTDDMLALLKAIETAGREGLKYISDAAKNIVKTVVPEWVWWVVGAAVIVGGGVAAWRLSSK